MRRGQLRAEASGRQHDAAEFLLWAGHSSFFHDTAVKCMRFAKPREGLGQRLRVLHGVDSDWRIFQGCQRAQGELNAMQVSRLLQDTRARTSLQSANLLIAILYGLAESAL